MGKMCDSAGNKIYKGHSGVSPGQAKLAVGHSKG